MADQAVQKTLEVKNKLGLHLRAAKCLVEALLPFADAEVTYSVGEKSANGRSILSLATLEAPIGTRVGVSATGPQAAEALVAIEKAFEERFGESE